MGHCLRAIIGPRSTVLAFAGRWSRADLVPLPQDFAFVPLSPALHEDIVELTAVEGPSNFSEFLELSIAAVQAIAQDSQHGPLGYIETDYFGGIGSQSAAIWERGQLTFGPLKQTVNWSGDEYVRTPTGQGPINQALARMGAWPRRGMDLFDTLGLGKYRSVE